MIKWEYLKLVWYPPFHAPGGYAQSMPAMWKTDDGTRAWEGHDVMLALVDLGQEGWELATVLVYPGTDWAILKRPIKKPPFVNYPRRIEEIG